MQEKSLAFWEKMRRFSVFFRSPERLRRCFQKIHTFLSVKRPADMLYYKYEKAREGTFGMARKIGFSKVPWLGVLAGLLGYFFHATMLSGGSAIPLIAFSVLMALLFWLSAATLEKRARYDEVFHPMRADALLSLLGALALGAGCVLRFSSDGTAVKLICTLGVVGALALLASGVLRLKQDAPPAMLYVPAILYYVCAALPGQG